MNTAFSDYGYEGYGAIKTKLVEGELLTCSEFNSVVDMAERQGRPMSERNKAFVKRALTEIPLL